MLCHQNGLGLDIKERANIAGCHSGGYDGTVFPAGQLENLELQLPQFMITMCCKLVCGSLDGVRLHEVDSLLSYDGWCGG